jgi:predicted nuclease of predicted toxin-antitoxin system
MKVLLDECVPFPLARLLPDCECVTARECGWGGFRNGDLLRVAEGKFDVFLTADKNLRYQQNLAGRALPIVELSTNDIRRIRASVGLVQAALNVVTPGDYRTVEIP